MQHSCCIFTKNSVLWYKKIISHKTLIISKMMCVNEKLNYGGSIPSRPQEAFKELKAFLVFIFSKVYRTYSAKLQSPAIFN